MRNLTNTEATDLAGLHVQLVDPVTGEMHLSYPADQFGGGAIETPQATAGQAIAIGTQAALDALTEKVTGGYYIVTDGTNQGDILVWADTNDDGVGDVWQVFQVPTNGLEWTVLTNVAGMPAGQYTYTLATDTWTKTADVEPVIPPVDDPIAVGGIKFPTQRSNFQVNNGPIFIMYDSVTGFGMTTSTATDDGTNGGVGAGARGETLRKSTFTLYQQNSPFTQIVNYRPFMVDVHQNGNGAIALDHKGVLWVKGNATFMSAFSSTESGLSTVAAPSFTPDKFWVDRSVKLVKIFLHASSNVIVAIAGDGTVWHKGAGGANGLNGNGTTVQDTRWHKVTLPQKAWKKVACVNDTHAFALTEDGSLYVWGNNASNRILSGGTGIYSTPVLPAELTNVPINDFASDANSVMAVSKTGVRWYIGTNASGKFGDGTTAAKTVWTNGAAFSGGFTFDRVADIFWSGSTAYAYITTDKKAVYTGVQNLQRGIAGKTGSDNVLTPTLMGAGAYQGTVVDIRLFVNTTLIHTNQGEVWTAVNGTGAAYGEAGWGVNAPAGNNIGLNTFKKVPVPAPVVSIYSTQNGGTEFAAGQTVLTTEGRVYSWSGWYSDLQNSVNYKRAPYEVPTNQFRQGEPKLLEQVDLMKVAGTITAATPLTITSIVDGVNGQTVTATFNATGAAGSVNLTGSTVTGPDTTFVSWLTPQVFMTAASANMTVQFVIDAADIATLNPPDTAPQSWTMNLIVNGV